MNILFLIVVIWGASALVDLAFLRYARGKYYELDGGDLFLVAFPLVNTLLALLFLVSAVCFMVFEVAERIFKAGYNLAKHLHNKQEGKVRFNTRPPFWYKKR